jgi:hypothetical protein
MFEHSLCTRVSVWLQPGQHLDTGWSAESSPRAIFTTGCCCTLLQLSIVAAVTARHCAPSVGVVGAALSWPVAPVLLPYKTVADDGCRAPCMCCRRIDKCKLQFGRCHIMLMYSSSRLSVDDWQAQQTVYSGCVARPNAVRNVDVCAGHIHGGGVCHGAHA